MTKPIRRYNGPDEIDIRNGQGMVMLHRIERHPNIISSSDIGIFFKPVFDHFGSPSGSSKRIFSPLSSSELRAWVNGLKERCCGCGEPDPTVLVFHHLDRSKKSMGVSNMASRRFTKPEILAEVEKCAVLCCNCHARFHVE